MHVLIHEWSSLVRVGQHNPSMHNSVRFVYLPSPFSNFPFTVVKGKLLNEKGPKKSCQNTYWLNYTNQTVNVRFSISLSDRLSRGNTNSSIQRNLKVWKACTRVNSANPTLSYPANKSIPVWTIHITPASSISSWVVGDNTRSLGTLDIRLVSSPVCVQCKRMVAPDELRRVSVTGETEPQASSEILQIKNNKCCREEK